MNSAEARGQIPQIIHQTWKTHSLPAALRPLRESFRQHHPGWEHRLWSDADNRELVARHYRWFLPIYDGYSEPIMRVDAARYLMMHRCGGVYADLDVLCLRPLQPLFGDHSLLLGEEPQAQLRLPKALERQFERIIANAVLISVPGHAFWEHVIHSLVASHREHDVLDATGPFMLTRAWQSFTEREKDGEGPAASDMKILPANQIYPLGAEQTSEIERDLAAGGAEITDDDRLADAYTVHLWRGTWWRPGHNWRRPLGRLRRWLIRLLSRISSSFPPLFLSLAARAKALIYRFLRPRGKLVRMLPAAEPPEAAAPPARYPPLSRHPLLLVLTPVKQAAVFLPTFLANLRTLDWPRNRLSLGFLESDSDDDTYRLLATRLPQLRREYRSVFLGKRDFGYRVPVPRWHASQQYVRRSIMARSRNELLIRALTDEQWVLWLDSDVEYWPPNIVDLLLEPGLDLVVPHCVRSDTGKTFDLNSFALDRNIYPDGIEDEKWLCDGILQPPVGEGRLYLGDIDSDKPVPLDGVGGTMLLLKADLHRHGLVFPPWSYRGYIETEGLAQMARDLGVVSWGLPWLEIIHP